MSFDAMETEKNQLFRKVRYYHEQFTVSALEANRSVIRISRMLTGRDKILVFNICYHGTVDEAWAAKKEIEY